MSANTIPANSPLAIVHAEYLAARESGEIPAFNPRFLELPDVGFYLYTDGRVFAEVDKSNDTIAIFSWSSSWPGHGHTKDALIWLRSQGCKSVVANGIGEIVEGQGSASVEYWTYMHSLGLVDILLDDLGDQYVPKL